MVKFGIWVKPRDKNEEPGFLTNLGRELSYDSYEQAEREMLSMEWDFVDVAYLEVREKPKD